MVDECLHFLPAVREEDLRRYLERLGELEERIERGDFSALLPVRNVGRTRHPHVMGKLVEPQVRPLPVVADVIGNAFVGRSDHGVGWRVCGV